MINDRGPDVAGLARRVLQLQWVCIAQCIAFIAYIAWGHVISVVQAQDSILLAKGLIIEDSERRPSVILGAPFPYVAGRSRRDAPTHAMIFLDEAGHDRLTVGESPDPQVSGKVLHRIARHFGIVIHDAVGDERGLYGYLSNGRVVVTLDRPGHEAGAVIVNDKTGFAGMSPVLPAWFGQRWQCY